jgi:hypothetical protein
MGRNTNDPKKLRELQLDRNNKTLSRTTVAGWIAENLIAWQLCCTVFISTAPRRDNGLHVRRILIIYERLFRQRNPFQRIARPNMGDRPQRRRIIERAAIDRDIFLRIGTLAPKDGEAMRTPVDNSPSLVGFGSLVGPCFSLSHGHSTIRNPQRQDKAGTGNRLAIGTVTGEERNRLRDNFISDVSADTASERVL